MKKRWKLLLTLGLALAALGVIGYIGMATQPVVPNLIRHHKETHDSSGNVIVTSQECIKCHGDKRSEVGFNTPIYTAHKRHNMSVYLRFNLVTPFDNDGDGLVDEDGAVAPHVAEGDDDNDDLVDEDGVESECAKCHQQTDDSLGQVVTNELGDIHPKKYIRLGSYEGGWLNDLPGNKSKRAARKQVDPDFCVSCHGGFRTEDDGQSPNKTTLPIHKVNGQSLAKVDPRGCTRRCHKDAASGGTAENPADEHRLVSYVNLRYASTSISCLKCHGGYQYYDVPEMNYPYNTYPGFPPYWPQQ